MHSLRNYLASQSGPSSASESEENENEKELECEKIKKPNKVQIVRNIDTKVKNRDSDYIITPDNYFMMNSSKKVSCICFEEDYIRCPQ